MMNIIDNLQLGPKNLIYWEFIMFISIKSWGSCVLNRFGYPISRICSGFQGEAQKNAELQNR